MFGNKISTDEGYKISEHSNVTTFVHALVHIAWSSTAY